MSADPSKPKRGAPTYPNSALAELDPLSVPFSVDGDVDLLLLDIEAPAEPVRSITPRAPSGARRGGAGRAALVVDSTPIARKFLAQRLQSLGYFVHVAENGEQALAMVDRQAFAIVFLELVLGPESGIDGLTLCRTIRQKPDHPRGIGPALVVVTGLTGSADRVRGSLAGCDAYLTKPLREADLVASLGEVDPLFN